MQKELIEGSRTTNPHCHLCSGNIKNLDHILRTCNKAKTFWRKLLTEDKWRKMQLQPFMVWLKENLIEKKEQSSNGVCKEKFSIYLWWLWR